MKMISIAFTLIFSLSLFASSQTKTFFYDGSQDSVQMSLNAEKTHTEYRYEQRPSICYRQQVYYRNVCHQTPDRRRVCRTVPEYRTVSYRCMETVRVGYEVKDYDVQANVVLDIQNVTGISAGETFKVTLDGDQLSLSSIGSKKFFIVLSRANVQGNHSGSVKYIQANYSAELIEAAPILKSLTLTNISLKERMLNFSMGPVLAQAFIGFKLNVSQSPILGSEEVLFDRELSASELDLNTNEQNSAGIINLQRLGVELVSGRYTLTTTVFFKFQGTLLNSSQFDKVETSRTLIYKIR